MKDSRQWSKEVQQQGQVFNLQENFKGKIGFTNKNKTKKTLWGTGPNASLYWVLFLLNKVWLRPENSVNLMPPQRISDIGSS